MIPTNADLQTLYHELAQRGASCHDPFPKRKVKSDLSLEEVWIKACEHSRFDPRLLQIALDFILQKATHMNPLKLRFLTQSSLCPQAVAVVLEFVRSVDVAEWMFDVCDFVVKNTMPVPLQFYFIGVMPFPLSRNMRKSLNFPIEEFLKWGFLAHEKIVLQKNGQRILLGNLSMSTRQNLIKNLAQQQASFSIGDYLNLIEQNVSRQQAFLDLKQSPFVKKTGKGRASFWQSLEKPHKS